MKLGFTAYLRVLGILYILSYFILIMAPYVGGVIMSLVQMKKGRPREVK